MNLADTRASFLAVRDDLEVMCERLVAELRAIVRDIPIAHAEVTGRVKKVNSYVTKVVRKNYANPLSTMADKVGLRVDVLYDNDRDRLVDRLQDEMDVVKSENKLEKLGADRLGYSGVHLDIIPRPTIEGYDDEVSKCEIQIRTRAQSTWAMASHELTYKTSDDPDVEIQRRLNRLSALIELFDDEVRRAREAVMKTELSPLAPLIEVLEDEFQRFRRLEYDRTLTRNVVSVLVRGLDDQARTQLAADLRSTVGEQVDFIERLMANYENDVRGALLGQPESLLVYHLLLTRPHDLKRRWQDELPMTYLEQLAGIFGKTIPDV